MSSFKGLVGGAKQLGYHIKGFSHHFPYEARENQQSQTMVVRKTPVLRTGKPSSSKKLKGTNSTVLGYTVELDVLFELCFMFCP